MITYDKTINFHTNGNYGIIATCTTNGKQPYVRYWFEEVSNLIGQTISYSCDVKSLNDPLSICIYQYDGTNYANSRIEVPVNTEGEYVITTNVNNTTIALWIGIEFKNSVNQGDSFYTDNWELFINDS